MKKLLTITAALCLCALSSQSQVILQDSFTYADGVTPTVSGGLWVVHSGSAGNSFIKNGRLEVFGARGDDVNRPFTNTLTSTIAYSSFIINATNFSASTNYIAHFMVNSTTFRAKVFAAGPGVAANTWRLGISAAGNAGTQAIFPLDLATNVDYRVVTSYDTVNRVAALWVDPVVATDANIVPSDTTTAATLVGYGFRQSSPDPALQIDNLYVGNAFSDVIVGTPKAPIIYYQPPAGPTTIFTGNTATFSCVAGGAGTVSFQWQHAGTNLVEDANTVGSTSNVLSLVSAVTTQTGAYKCIVTSTTNSIFAGSVTSIVAQVVVSAAPVPPTFITQPVSQSVYRGQTVTFSTTVNSPGNVSYQWFSNNIALPSETASTLVLVGVTTNITGSTYKVAVTNDVVANGVVSTNGVLTVTNPPAVSVSFLRSLVDSAFIPTASPNQPYQVTGIITTLTNITTGNTASYFLQDGTGGINIFATFGSTFRPTQGDSVTYVGVLSSFSSGLELVVDPAKPYTSYTINSSGNALPAPKIIPLNVTNFYGYAYVNTNLAGSLVTLTNVYFGTNNGSVLSATVNQTVTVTNAAGQIFNLSFFFLDQDTAGQTLPEYATSVTGVLYGVYTNYTVAVTKFSDIVAGTPTIAPIPLTTSLSGSILTISWSSASFNLQSSTNVAGPYNFVPNAVSPFTTNILSLPAQFFRLTTDSPVPPG